MQSQRETTSTSASTVNTLISKNNAPPIPYQWPVNNRDLSPNENNSSKKGSMLWTVPFQEEYSSSPITIGSKR